MTLAATLSVVVALAGCGGSSGAGGRRPSDGWGTRTSGADRAIARAYAEVPLAFETNDGQGPSDASFLAHGGGYDISLGRAGVAFALNAGGTDHQSAGRRWTVGRLAFTGGQASRPRATTRLPGTVNYLIGSDPRDWHRRVATFARVSYRAVWPGIDVAFHGDQQRLEWDFKIAAGASAAAIGVRMTGVGRARHLTGGALGYTLRGRRIVIDAPVAYQSLAGRHRPVACRFVVRGGVVRVRVGRYDRRAALVIDPQLDYSTYLAGAQQGTGVAVDGHGDAYVTGSTSSGFPATAGAFEGTAQGGGDAYVAKFDPTRSGTASLIYATYIGGANADAAAAIAIDAQGEAYVTGATDSTGLTPSGHDFPTTVGAYDTVGGSNSGGDSAFVAKLSSDGSNLLYSSFFSGNATVNDRGTAIAVDASGHAYITGVSPPSTFPVTAGALQPTSTGSDDFVVEINPAGGGSADLMYSTFIGGGRANQATGIALDAGDDVYVVGDTNGNAGFPSTAGAFQTASPGGVDGYLMKIRPHGAGAADLLYSTLIGGSAFDLVNAVAVDPANGHAYVTGRTSSTDFPTTAGAIDRSGDGSIFAAEINLAGGGAGDLGYSTYLASASGDDGSGIAVDSGGDIYLAGTVDSTAFPTTSGAFQTTAQGGNDAFAAKIHPAGHGSADLLYSTHLGGSLGDVGQALAVDGAGNFYVAGLTASTNFPTTAGALDATAQTTFFSKLTPGPVAMHSLAVQLVGAGTGTVTGDASPAINCPGTCSQQYADGTTITLTAAASTGSTFAGWSGGGCTGSAPTCQVTLTAGVTVTATFASATPVRHNLVVQNPGTAGEITGSGIDCGAGHTTCTAAYDTGTAITLHAAPSAGNSFTVWSGDCGGSADCQLTMDADHSVAATLVPTGPPPVDTVTLTITIAGDGVGVIAPSNASGCDHLNPQTPPTTCTITEARGSVVTLHALPGSASEFGGWFGACFTNAADCTVTLNADLTVSAYFNRYQTLSVSVAGDGTGLVTGSVSCGRAAGNGPPNVCNDSFGYGRTPTLTAVPTSGSRFVGWSGACSGTGSCSVFMIADKSVTATFAYDAGAVHVNAIEVTQGVQTSELPTRSAATPSVFRVAYSGVTLPSSGAPSTTVKLAQDHATVVRVYVNTQLVPNGQIPPMRLYAIRDGKIVPPGAIAPDPPAPKTSPVYQGTLGSVTTRYSDTGAYTFTLPWGWAEGDVDFVADTNPVPGVFPFCPVACQERGIILQGVHFNPVTQVDVYPLAIGADGLLPAASRLHPNVPIDPAWTKVQEVIPFPIYVHPYVEATDATGLIAGCAGQVQGNGESNAAFAARVRIARNGALRAIVASWAASNDATIGDYPFGIVRSEVANDCPNASLYSGGQSQGGPLFTAQPSSASTDDRPLTGIAHEFEHGIGLVHAGVECGSGPDGTASAAVAGGVPPDGINTSQTATTTIGSNQLTAVASVVGLAAGEAIAGPGIAGGTAIAAISGSTITMTTKATATNTSVAYTFANDDGLSAEVGEPWAPAFTNSTGGSVDGALDGVGLVGLENQSNSPYKIRYNDSLPTSTLGGEIYDLMSYCTGGREASSWISVRNWNRDIDFHAPGVTAAAAAHSAYRILPSATPRAIRHSVFRTVPPATPRAIRTLAVISVYDPLRAKALVTDVTPDASNPTPPTPAAMYSLIGRDAAGHVVARAGASASLVHVDHSTSLITIVGKIDAAHVHELDVMDAGQTIAQERASAHAPTVRIISPHGHEGREQRGFITLRWHSRDADGGPLQAAIRYSADGGRTWRTVYTGADHGAASLPSALLSASRHARIRIYISDGFREAIATSLPFVSRGAPPVISVTTPRSGARIAAGAPLLLNATAYDDRGTRLTGRALVWRAAGHVIATGAQAAPISLPAGRHRVTLTARDQTGRITSIAVTVRVIASPPVLASLRAPRRVSPKTRSVKIRVSVLAPATLTIGRRRYAVDHQPRWLRVAIRPGVRPVAIVLVLRSGRYVTRVPITIDR